MRYLPLICFILGALIIAFAAWKGPKLLTKLWWVFMMIGFSLSTSGIILMDAAR